jgi:hypothetical protein
VYVVPLHRAIAAAVATAGSVALAGAAVVSLPDDDPARTPSSVVVQDAPFVGPRAPLALAGASYGR